LQLLSLLLWETWISGNTMLGCPFLQLVYLLALGLKDFAVELGARRHARLYFGLSWRSNDGSSVLLRAHGASGRTCWARLLLLALEDYLARTDLGLANRPADTDTRSRGRCRIAGSKRGSRRKHSCNEWGRHSGADGGCEAQSTSRELPELPSYGLLTC
jgi:hypothetical protein